MVNGNHTKIVSQIETLAKMRNNIKQQNREPTDLEIKAIASYNLGLYEKALQMMKHEEEVNPHKQKIKMSQLQKNKLALEFI